MTFLTGERLRFGLAVFGVSALAVFLLAACSDTEPSGTGTPSAPTSSGPSLPSSSIPTASTPTLKPLPRPTKPFPVPTVTGAPESDAPLAQRIRFAIAKQTQVTAGKAAKTTVNCPGIDAADKPGKHTLKCTVTYAGKPFTGTLTVDAQPYNASYKFSSEQVAVVKEKVVDAVLRAVPDASNITCTMDLVAVVPSSGDGIRCDVTTTANAVVPHNARISGDGKILVAKV
ncbi:hypothetical protein GCM10029976_027220 [Kribbella albertanoniae]|uniref:DUF4333 domain-containing protein n=1 Tax=Kribbella albertanoniae TaxID=1266829 RepID=A0A4R4PQA6_9ACTN|nr:hypothetical protein [Kribbella albertanoniae]TDC24461.1 hypothetical protein E1261_26195 [Kribbella albertanoniae]